MVAGGAAPVYTRVSALEKAARRPRPKDTMSKPDEAADVRHARTQSERERFER